MPNAERHLPYPTATGGAPRAPRALSPFSEPSCQPWQNPYTKLGIRSKHAEMSYVGTSTPGSTAGAPSWPRNTPSLLGIKTVIISLAFIISAVAIVCAANKWYEYLFLYSSPIIHDYRERQLDYEERQEARRRAAANAEAAAEEEEQAAYRIRVEELYTSIASTSYDHHRANPRGDSSGSSSPEIHPASSSSSSSFSFGSASRAHHGHVDHMLSAARSGPELHTSR